MLADGTIVYDTYSTLCINKVIRGNAMRMLPGSVGVACSPILSVRFKGMDYEPVLNLAATLDEAVSIVCTFVDKTIPSTLGEVDDHCQTFGVFLNS
jgi:hypothetical protein